MSMTRKLIRNQFRAEAEAHSYKASKWVHNAWDLYSRQKLGATARMKNVARGTKPKKLWKYRIQAVLG